MNSKIRIVLNFYFLITVLSVILFVFCPITLNNTFSTNQINSSNSLCSNSFLDTYSFSNGQHRKESSSNSLKFFSLEVEETDNDEKDDVLSFQNYVNLSIHRNYKPISNQFFQIDKNNLNRPTMSLVIIFHTWKSFLS